MGEKNSPSHGLIVWAERGGFFFPFPCAPEKKRTFDGGLVAVQPRFLVLQERVTILGTPVESSQ